MTICLTGDPHEYALKVRESKNMLCVLFFPFQMKQAQRSKSPPKPSSKKPKKNKKDEPTENKPNKALPDVVPSETDAYDEVLPPPPRRPSKVI